MSSFFGQAGRFLPWRRRGDGGSPARDRALPLEVACTAVLGTEVAQLKPGGVEIRPYHGSTPWGSEPCPLWVVDTLLGAVVNVQAPLVEAVEAALAERDPSEPLLSKQNRALLLTAALSVTSLCSIWENLNYYTDRDHFVSWAEHRVSPLGGRNGWQRLAKTQEPVSPEAMTASFGVRVAGRVVSYADVKRRTDLAWSVGVWTDEPHRNARLGRAAVSAATRYVLNAGRIPLYITDKGNASSMALCQALGYQKFGEDLYCFRPK